MDVNVLIRLITISLQPIVGSDISFVYSSIYYHIINSLIFPIVFLIWYLLFDGKEQNRATKNNLDCTKWKVLIRFTTENPIGPKDNSHLRKVTIFIGNQVKTRGTYQTPWDHVQVWWNLEILFFMVELVFFVNDNQICFI